MQDAPIVEKMRALGNDVTFKGSKAFAEEIALEIAMFKRVIERGDITVNVEGGVLKNRERVQGRCD